MGEDRQTDMQIDRETIRRQVQRQVDRRMEKDKQMGRCAVRDKCENKRVKSQAERDTSDRQANGHTHRQVDTNK